MSKEVYAYIFANCGWTTDAFEVALFFCDFYAK